MFTIRRFKFEDLAQVVRLVDGIFHEKYDDAMYMNLFNSWPDGFLVVEYGGYIVAFLLGMVSAPGQIRVLLLGVAPGYWSRGLGTQLLLTFMQNGRSIPADYITLEVRMRNTRALTFYYRHGFAITGMIPKYYKDGEDAHVMSRPMQ